MIQLRTALLLFGLLVLAALLTLKGKFLALALIVVLALAAKSCVDYLRRRQE